MPRKGDEVGRVNVKSKYGWQEEHGVKMRQKGDMTWEEKNVGEG